MTNEELATLTAEELLNLGYRPATAEEDFLREIAEQASPSSVARLSAQLGVLRLPAGTVCPPPSADPTLPTMTFGPAGEIIFTPGN